MTKKTRIYNGEKKDSLFDKQFSLGKLESYRQKNQTDTLSHCAQK